METHISLFFVDFPKGCIIPFWSFHMCLSTFQNIFAYPILVIPLVFVDFLKHFLFKENHFNRCSIGWGSFCSSMYTFRESMYTSESRKIFLV